MYSIQKIKDSIDLHELASRLGWRRQGERGNYHSPHHKDKNPSVSIFQDGKAWKDHSSSSGGSCIDMVMYHFEVNFEEAMDWLRREYDMPAPKEAPPLIQREPTLAEIIANNALKDTSAAIEYLTNERGFDEAFVRKALKHKTIGWNNYTNKKRPEGQVGHGGPGLATIVRTLNPGHVIAVDMRYQNPALNGGLKTMSQGEKENAPWILNPRAFKSAWKVVITESAINALCVEATEQKGVIGLAMRGTQTIKSFDARLLIGKQVVLCGDCDDVKDGKTPGDEFMHELYDQLTAHGIPTFLVDHGVEDDRWQIGEDLNDILKRRGVGGVKNCLDNLQTTLIPGQRRNGNRGKNRLFLPSYDDVVYYTYQVAKDFMRDKVEVVDKEGGSHPKFTDICAFRIASLSQLDIQSERATVTGDIDHSPNTQFCAFIQGPEDGFNLVRKVMTREQLHSVDTWKKVGKIFAPNKFMRALSIWGRASSLYKTNAVNFIGLCFKDGKPFVSEGKDCYFRNPDQQCHYQKLVFRCGSVNDARAVVQAFAKTFGKSQALHMLVWALGCHLKCHMGFWPHFVVQGDKATGKSTLAITLGRVIDMDVFGGQTVATSFRQVVTTSYSSHPVAWEEISEAGVKSMKSAQSLLQDLYRWNTSKRTSEALMMLHITPVMLVGESMDMDTIHGKTARTYLEKQYRGAPIDHDIPNFPMRNWLDFLATKTPDQVREAYQHAYGHLSSFFQERDDAGAQRMVHNYACIGMTWYFLCEFTQLDVEFNDYFHTLAAAMNEHIKETGQRRDPWTWVVEAILNDIDRGEYHFPHDVSTVQGELCFIFRPKHALFHIESTSRTNGLWERLPVKSDRVIKRQMHNAGVIVKDNIDRKFRLRNLKESRYSHMVALSVHKLEEYGIYVPIGDGRAPVSQG